MKREILFRGKSIYTTHDWLLGSLIVRGDKTYIIPSDRSIKITMGGCEVIPETVGQFTGLSDKKYVKIFEGDKITVSCEGRIYRQWVNKEIVFNDGCFGFYHDIISKQSGEVLMTIFEPLSSICTDILDIEVVGNIHETPNF